MGKSFYYDYFFGGLVGGEGNVTFENYCILRSTFVGNSENEFQASTYIS